MIDPKPRERQPHSPHPACDPGQAAGIRRFITHSANTLSHAHPKESNRWMGTGGWARNRIGCCPSFKLQDSESSLPVAEPDAESWEEFRLPCTNC